jgi:hypothetical protein
MENTTPSRIGQSGKNRVEFSTLSMFNHLV